MTWLGEADRFEQPEGALRFALFLDLLARYEPGRMLELGAGHGMFGRIATDQGWTVTAVDARGDRVPGEHPNMEWVIKDIRDYVDYGDHDLVVVLGLWYHLTLDDQLQLARRAHPRPMIIDTHIALADHDRNNLGDLITLDGYTGRLYDESEIQDQSPSSFGNLSSFWPTIDSLCSLLHDSGYDMVETISPRVGPARRFFLARTWSDQQRRQIDASMRFSPRVKDSEPAPWESRA